MHRITDQKKEKKRNGLDKNERRGGEGNEDTKNHKSREGTIYPFKLGDIPKR